MEYYRNVHKKFIEYALKKLYIYIFYPFYTVVSTKILQSILQKCSGSRVHMKFFVVSGTLGCTDPETA